MLTKRKYFSRKRQQMFAFLPDDAKTFLDVGCAEGNFGDSIKQRDQTSVVWGIELVEAAARAAEKCLDHVLLGDACALLDSLPNRTFDCVVCNDSLEHMADPHYFLESLKPKLQDGGCVVASIPNVRNYKVLAGLLFKHDWRYEDAGVLDRTHLRFFTRKSIERLFDEAGYQVEIIAPINKSRKIKVRIWVWITLGWLSDIVVQQYACRARVRSKS